MRRTFESFRLSRQAEIDLAEIYAFTVANWSIDQANRYTADISAAVTGLVDGGKAGRRRTDVSGGYLSYVVGAHVIFYRETNLILVARVLHSAMDVARHL